MVAFFGSSLSQAESPDVADVVDLMFCEDRCMFFSVTSHLSRSKFFNGQVAMQSEAMLTCAKIVTGSAIYC